MNIEQLKNINNQRQMINPPNNLPSGEEFTREANNTKLDIVRTNIYDPRQIVDESFQIEENRLNNYIQNKINFKNAVRNGTFNLNSDFESMAMEHTSLGNDFSGNLYGKLAESKTGATAFQTVTSDGMNNVISSNRASQLYRNDQITPQSALADEVVKGIVNTLQAKAGVNSMSKALLAESRL
jgi:hypothetical protein